MNNIGNHVFSVASFTGDFCDGNKHIVILCSKPVVSSEFESLSRIAGEYILVVFVMPAGTAKTARVFFFHRGQSISRCGSGSVALAYVLVEKLRLRVPISITTTSGAIRVGKHDRLYYETAHLPMCETSKTQWTHLVNCRLGSAYLVGGVRDYCILVLRDEKTLRNLTLNVKKIQLTTKRALIATCESTATGCDYAMRYFAPQYGNYEDSATGSANAMLAIFWQKKLRKKTVAGLQLSDAGGLFRVQNLGLSQRVYGKTREITLPKTVEVQLAVLG